MFMCVSVPGSFYKLAVKITHFVENNSLKLAVKTRSGTNNSSKPAVKTRMLGKSICFAT
jgi:hypothetical protein